MWVYVILLWGMHRRAFEMEIIAFFLSTLSLAVMAASIPGEVLKQFISVVIGVGLFFFMCTFLRNLGHALDELFSLHCIHGTDS